MVTLMPRARRTCARCPAVIDRGATLCPACETKRAHDARSTPDARAADRERGTAHQRGYTSPGHRAFRTAVLARDPICVLCRASWSTVADHWPTSRRDLVEAGLDPNDPARGRGLCKRCHDQETAVHQPGGWNAPNRGAMAAITVVYGPPCAGKTTYVAEHRDPDDVVIDLDALAEALGSTRTHDHGQAHIQAAAIARDALIPRYLTEPSSASRVWIIQTARPLPTEWPSTAALVPVATDPATCHDRAHRQRRHRDAHDAIDAWWAANATHSG